MSSPAPTFHVDPFSIRVPERICLNFFESEEAAWTWSRGRGLQGRVLTLEEASKLATKEWEQLTGGFRS